MLHHLSQQSDQDKQKKTGTGVSIGSISFPNEVFYDTNVFKKK